MYILICHLKCKKKGFHLKVINTRFGDLRSDHIKSNYYKRQDANPKASAGGSVCSWMRETFLVKSCSAKQDTQGFAQDGHLHWARVIYPPRPTLQVTRSQTPVGPLCQSSVLCGWPELPIWLWLVETGKSNSINDASDHPGPPSRPTSQHRP